MKTPTVSVSPYIVLRQTQHHINCSGHTTAGNETRRGHRNTMTWCFSCWPFSVSECASVSKQPLFMLLKNVARRIHKQNTSKKNYSELLNDTRTTSVYWWADWLNGWLSVLLITRAIHNRQTVAALCLLINNNLMMEICCCCYCCCPLILRFLSKRTCAVSTEINTTIYEARKCLGIKPTRNWITCWWNIYGVALVWKGNKIKAATIRKYLYNL